MGRTIAVSRGTGAQETPVEHTLRGHPHRGPVWILALASVGLVLSGCSLHVTKNGISGNAFGHNFSGATGALPSGFPSSVPSPGNSRVLAGGGTSNNWDVGFAVTGSTTSGASAYQSKFQSAGYAVTNVQTGSSPVSGGTGSSSTPTTVTVTTSAFTAKNAQWTVQVLCGSSTSSTSGGGLKAGEFAVNITVIPTSSVTPAT